MTRAATESDEAPPCGDLARSLVLGIRFLPRRFLPRMRKITLLALLHSITACVSSQVEQQPYSRPPSNSMFPQWSPDGSLIAFASDRDGNPEIYTMHSDGSDIRRLTSTPGRNAHPSFSPDGRKIVFQSPRENGRDTNLYIMNVDGTDVVQLTHLAGFAGVPHFSPDNKRIAFQWRASSDSHDDSKWHLVIIGVSGEGFHLVGPTYANDQVPNWAIDGAHLLFFSDRSQKNQLYTMDDDGTDVRVIAQSDFNDVDGSWSPTDDRIAFISDRDGASDLYVMDVSGHNVRRLTRTSATKHGPLAWSPSGDKIAFSENIDGTNELCLINVDGSHLVHLAGLKQ
jgi:Tol biopolymer transport system component